MGKKKIEIKWLVEPEGHDYPAAKSFLRLIYTDRAAAGFVSRGEGSKKDSRGQ